MVLGRIVRILGVALAIGASAHAGVGEPQCLADGGSMVRTLAGTFDEPQGGALPPGGTIDARDASFALFPYDRVSGRTQANLYPIVTTGESFCFAGGNVRGDYGNNRYHRIPDNGVFLPFDFFPANAEKPESWNSAGFVFGDDEAPGGTVEGISIWNTWDGVRVRKKDDWLVRGSLISHVHDDCVANDGLRSGAIVDSLLDGCSTGLSVEPIEVGASGEGEVVRIERSLVRLEPMAGPPGNYAPYGHEGFIEMGEGKDVTRTPKLVIEDSIFLAEMASREPAWMGFTPELVASCRNNVVVWLGAGAFPGELPACFTLTRDRAVWDAAVTDWRRRHPNVGAEPASAAVGAAAAPRPALPPSPTFLEDEPSPSLAPIGVAPVPEDRLLKTAAVAKRRAAAPKPAAPARGSVTAIERALRTHPLHMLFLGVVLGAAAHDRIVSWLRRRKRELALDFRLVDARPPILLG